MKGESSTMRARMSVHFRCPPASGWEGAGEGNGVPARGFKTDKKGSLQVPCAVEQSLAARLEGRGVGLMIGVGDVKDFADGIDEEAEEAVSVFKDENIFRSLRGLHAEQ